MSKTPLKHELAAMLAAARAEISQLRADIERLKAERAAPSAERSAPRQQDLPAEPEARRALMERMKAVATKRGCAVRAFKGRVQVKTESGWDWA